MSLKFTLLGCGSSFGVPRADGNWGKCHPKLLKNYRTRCSALISSNNLKILIDTSPDLRFQLIKQKIFNIDKVLYLDDLKNKTQLLQVHFSIKNLNSIL